MDRLRKRTWVFISLVVIMGVLLGVAPSIAKNYLVKNSKNLLGRKIAVDNLKFNYFNGKVKITDFTMYESNGTSTFVDFDTLIINAVPYKLLASKLDLQEVYLKGLEAIIVQNDSVFNFDDLITFFSSEESQSDTEEESSFDYDIENIQLKASKLIYKDSLLGSEMVLSDLSLSVPNLKSSQQDSIKGHMDFFINDKGHADLDFALLFGKTDSIYSGHLSLDSLEISPFLPYSKDYLAANSLNGSIDTELDINGSLVDFNKLGIQGKVTANNVTIHDLDSTKAIAANKIEAELYQIEPMKSNYVFGEIHLEQPFVHFSLRDSLQNNITDLLEPYLNTSKPDSLETASEPDSLYYFINSFRVDNGVLEYVDNTTAEPFEYDISQMHIETDSISSVSDWLTINAHSVLNDRGELIAELGIDPNDVYEMQLDYSIKDFQLTDLNIYSKHYMGVPLLQGDMFYKGSTKIDRKTLASDNNIVIEDVKLGDKVKGLYSLPLKFAVFLLKDQNGDIKLDVPVSGDLNDPKISIGKIVWTTVKNLITKTASAPANRLAGLIGANPKDLQDLEFVYGDSILTEKHKKKLDALLDLETKKEGLRIRLKYFNDVERELEEIALIEAKKMFDTTNFENIKSDNTQFVSFLRDKTEKDGISVEEASLTVIGQENVEAMQGQVSEARYGQIKLYLLSKSDSTSIDIVSYYKDSPKNLTSKPIFEINFSDE